MHSGAWKWIVPACRLILGGVFIYASIDKIAHPDAFADILYNYHLVPAWGIHFLAAWLPVLELLAGICLISGILLRGAATISGGLLIVFIVALGINLFRGYNIDCGCFTTGAGTHEGGMIALILRDILLLAPAVLILLHEYRYPRPRES